MFTETLASRVARLHEAKQANDEAIEQAAAGSPTLESLKARGVNFERALWAIGTAVEKVGF